MKKSLGIMRRILLILGALIFINVFLFSWFDLALAAAGLCAYKGIAVPTYNGYDKPLSEMYDLQAIASILRSNRYYSVNTHFNGDGLRIARTFNRVEYNITLVNRNGRTGFNLNNYNLQNHPPGRISEGASCATPDLHIWIRTLRMINDLPLSAAQKLEMVRNIRIGNVIHIDWFL
ncbi:MAG: hypothetical protein ACM3QS_12765 [Bacteroidota bacterium]